VKASRARRPCLHRPIVVRSRFRLEGSAVFLAWIHRWCRPKMGVRFPLFSPTPIFDRSNTLGRCRSCSAMKWRIHPMRVVPVDILSGISSCEVSPLIASRRQAGQQGGRTRIFSIRQSRLLVSRALGRPPRDRLAPRYYPCDWVHAACCSRKQFSW